MVNRVFLILGVAGAAASLAVHLGAWLGAVAGCDVTFLLFSGSLLVWWRAITSTAAAFQTRQPGMLWREMSARCPPWVRRAYTPITYYALGSWAYVTYVAMFQRVSPSAAVWARFYSVFTFFFYFFASAFLWAAINAIVPVQAGAGRTIRGEGP